MVFSNLVSSLSHGPRSSLPPSFDSFTTGVLLPVVLHTILIMHIINPCFKSSACQGRSRHLVYFDVSLTRRCARPTFLKVW